MSRAVVAWAFVPVLVLAVLPPACSDDEGSQTTGAGTAGAAGGGAQGGAGGAQGGAGGGAPRVTVEPTEIDDLLANPGMGWQTFHTTADQDPDLDGLPSGSAYYRFTWRSLEPTDGNIDVGPIASRLAQARAAGQTLMFRVMTAGSNDQYTPTWLEAAGCNVFQYQYGGTDLIAPDLDDATCWTRFQTLMETIAAELGDEPDLQIDIGGVGLWGEWHFSSTTPQVPMPSLATRQAVVDLHLTLFPNSPQTALIGDVESLTYATGLGAGWRADCLGDLGFFSDTWNHMDDMYQQHVDEAQAGSAWQQGPVAWESCGNMQDWVDRGYDVHYIFQYALDMHGSFLNNKSAPLPTGSQYRNEVEWLLQTLGYRLVLRSLTHPESVASGGTLDVEMSWENLGVAPPYNPFALQVQLTPPAEASAEPVMLEASADLRTWLPGTTEVSESLPLPTSMPAGIWALSVGVTGTPGIPMVRLAIDGRDAEGWYPLSSVEVR
ncbi:MAG: DUF4832 domain-containing protein [Deltaproteobacteria bacterium]|jgi:hypothetical protein|nr:DUF4832 domain-containing protein [Deltaproteobacteria bacterium]MBW2532520.1 DUF4832 domain-containing protein [Deltaproteobacteria bacterium]